MFKENFLISIWHLKHTSFSSWIFLEKEYLTIKLKFGHHLLNVELISNEVAGLVYQEIGSVQTQVVSIFSHGSKLKNQRKNDTVLQNPTN